MKIVDLYDRFVEEHKTTIIASAVTAAVTAAVAIVATRNANTVTGARAAYDTETGALVVYAFQKNGRKVAFDWPDANLTKKA